MYDKQTKRKQVSTIDLPEHETGIWGSCANVINAIVGSGIIGIPFAFTETGLIAGIVLLLLVAFCTDKSLRMIVDLISFNPKLKHHGVYTFEDLVQIPFGKAGRIAVLFSMFVLAYGPMISYLIIIKDTLPVIFHFGTSFLEVEGTLIVAAIVVILPLCLLRDISQLAFTSVISVIADIVLVILIAIYSPVASSIHNYGGFAGVVSDFWIQKGFFVGLGIISFALACQHSAILVSATLKDKTPTRWATVTRVSVTLATFLSLVMGIFGFLGFLGDTQGDILNNFPNTPGANAARGLLAVTMFFTYPMECFVTRHVFFEIFYEGHMDKKIEVNGEMVLAPKFLGVFGRRELWTIVLFSSSLLIAIFVDNVGIVLSLTGAIGASLLCYMLPGVAYLGVNGSEFLDWCAKFIHVVDTEDDACKTIDDTSVSEDKAECADCEASSSSIMDVHGLTVDLPQGRRPVWWYLLLFPLWAWIAKTGSKRTQAFLIEFGEPDKVDHKVPETKVETRDFGVSMFLIVFGCIALLAGLVSSFLAA